MIDAMNTPRDEMLALKNKESGVDKTSDSAQAKPMPGPSKTDPPTRTSDPVHSDHSEVQPMNWSLMALHFLQGLLKTSLRACCTLGS